MVSALNMRILEKDDSPVVFYRNRADSIRESIDSLPLFELYSPDRKYSDKESIKRAVDSLDKIFSKLIVTKGTLERLMEIKQTYGIGSKQAWEYLKVERKPRHPDDSGADILFFEDSDHLDLKEDEEDWHSLMRPDSTFISAYGRAVIENTLNKMDVERRIALHYVLRDHDIAIFPDPDNEKYLAQPADEIVDKAVDTLKMVLYNINQHKKILPKDRKQSHEVVYKILRGEQTEEEGRDYKFRRLLYTIQAIENNKSWLKRMIS